MTWDLSKTTPASDPAAKIKPFGQRKTSHIIHPPYHLITE